jgi:hypothetical protein
MHETAAKAALKTAATNNKNGKKAAFGWNQFNTDAQLTSYDKRLARVRATGDSELRGA